MRPFVIRQGDTLTKLANQFQFEATTIWNDDANTDLRKVRSDPDLLLATDVLYIPDPSTDDVSLSLTTGATNAFVSDPPTMPICVQFPDPRFASQPYTVAELDHLTGLATDASGLLTFDAPVTLDTATITFAALGLSCALRIGHLDPIETPSGLFQRLQSLGYIATGLPFDPHDHDVMRDALTALRGADGERAALPYDEAALDFSPDSTVSITVFVSPGAVQYQGASSDTGGEGQPSVPNDSSTAPDSGGLVADVIVRDDGTIDDASRTLVLRAYGC